MPKKKNKFELVQMPPQNTNSVVIFDGDNCVVFDPWGRADDWEKYFVSHDVTPTAIYATHVHPDHISAAAQIATRFNIDWYMSHMDLDLIEWGNGLLDYFNLPKLSPNDKAPIDIKPATQFCPTADIAKAIGAFSNPSGIATPLVGCKPVKTSATRT